MPAFESDRPRRALPLVLVLLLLVLAALAAAAWFLRPRFESEPPQVRVGLEGDVLGLKPVEIEVTDPGSGLKSASAVLVAGGKEFPLGSQTFPAPVPGHKFTLDPAKLPGLAEGTATLRVSATDASYANLFKGNAATVEKALAIDATPPTIGLVADDRYVNFGGVGLVAYTASPDTVESGVKVGERFFPGFKGAVQGQPDRYVAFFAHPYDAPPEARARLVATDRAGNAREMPLAYELKNVKYKKSTLPLSEGFVRNKVAPLLKDAALRQGSIPEVFVAVNTGVRKENEDRIARITGQASPRMLWKGAFAQLSNSKVEANFADLRTYTWNGAAVDTKYHLGYDLSVTKAYPVEAANAGRVAFAGDLGIYGNSVILDHGLGLFTLYSHMSSIDVKEGAGVEKKQVLGRTGETGLAAGDHLHYGVYLAGVAVLPVEWWDAKWIADNVEPKLAGGTSQEIAEAQKPAPRKRRR